MLGIALRGRAACAAACHTRVGAHGPSCWGLRGLCQQRTATWQPCRPQAASTEAAAAPCVLHAPTEEALGTLAVLLAEQGLRAGDVYLLYGAVGAGKSVFSRAFIRAALGDPHLPVPSPTYLLQVCAACACTLTAVHALPACMASGASVLVRSNVVR